MPKEVKRKTRAVAKAAIMRRRQNVKHKKLTTKQTKKRKTLLTVQVLSFNGKTGRMTLPEEIFGVKAKPETLAQAVRVYLENLRKGTATTRTRGEVSGGGRKPWRQKGTGRARAGSIRAPHWKGGGVVFGPTPRDFSAKLPKKVRQKALFGALSSKLAEGDVKIVDNFEKIAPKTRELVKVLGKLGLLPKKALFVVDGNSENLVRAGRNLPNISFCKVENLTTYQILAVKNLIFTKAAIGKLKERTT